MIAQFVVSIGMHEHVEYSVVERKPTYNVGKISRPKRNLIAPSWVGPDGPLMKTSHLNSISKLHNQHIAKAPGCVAT